MWVRAFVVPVLWLVAGLRCWDAGSSTSTSWLHPQCKAVVIAARDTIHGEQVRRLLVRRNQNLPAVVVMNRDVVYSDRGIHTSHAQHRLLVVTLADENGERPQQGDVQALLLYPDQML